MTASRLLEVWDDLVDPRVGIVQSVTALALEADEPNFFHYLSTASDTRSFGALGNYRNNGGVSTERNRALAKAAGEAVERYCSALFVADELPLGRHRDLDLPAPPPERYALYVEEQFSEPGFPWAPFTPDSMVRWVEARALVGDEPRLVPAPMTYVPYHYSPDEAPIAEPISTGLAAGGSFADAALNGLCEAIERDAFTITWQARQSAPRVSRSTLPDAALDLLERYEAVGLSVEVMDITSDLGVPTLLTVALGNADSSPAVAVAAATDPSPLVALVKSLEELAHTRKYARQVMDFMPPVAVDVAAGHPDVRDQYAHLRFYCPQEAKEFARFLWAGPEERDFGALADFAAPDAAQSLARLVARLDAAGYEAVACDLTTPDVASLGLSVVRVIVPGLHPLFMGHQNRARGGRRLYEVPGRLGRTGLAPGAPDNPYPHPFP